MLTATQLIAFLPSVDLERSERFFQGVLDLPLVSRSPYALVFATAGASLRVTKVEDLRPQPFTVFGWLVLDIHAAIEELRGRGVAMLRYGGMDQDDDGVWTPGGGDMIAWFQDPDSNVLSLTEFAST